MPKSPPAILALTALFAASLFVPLAARAMVVPIDHTARLSISGSASSVVVGNPAIADVTVVDSHTLYVSGRGYGSTDLTVLDSGGRTLYAGDISVTAAGANVSVYRGGSRTSVICNPRCTEAAAPATQQAAAQGGGLLGGGLLGGLGVAMAKAVTPGLAVPSAPPITP